MSKTERELRDFEMTVWNVVPFEELLIESRDGEWGLGEPTVGHQLCEIIRGTDFAGLHSAGIELPKRWIPDHIVDRKRLKVGDIVLETAGGTAKQSTGRSALLTTAFFEKHNSLPVLCASFSRHLRLDKNRFDSGFIYYLLQALYSAGYMAVYNLQHTGVARFQYTSFKKKTVLNIPDKSTQRKIAATLSSYDDLIENNRRRIELLEKMAEELYREWFVRFRFPGYQQAKFHKGLPAEWELKKLKDILELCYGKALKEEQRHPGSFPVYGSSGVVGYHNKALVNGPGIVVGRKGNVGSIHWSDTGFFPIDTTYFVKAKISLHYVFFMLGGLNFINNDSAVPGLNREQAYSNPVLLPPAALIEKFVEVVISYFAEKQHFLKKNEILSGMRDQLLSRLISGKLPVDSLAIHFPPSMREADEARQDVVHA